MVTRPWISPTSRRRYFKNPLYRLLTGLVFLCGACSAPTPKINTEYLPIAFQVDSRLWSGKSQEVNNGRLLILNGDKGINFQVIQLWRQHKLYGLYKQSHPYEDYTERDIQILQLFMNTKLDIYFWIPNKTRSHNNTDPLFQIKRELKSAPLSNAEITFLMSADPSNPFPLKQLTLLIISSQELVIRNGGIPRYPQVLSPTLRERMNLPPLPEIPAMNLFATKNASGLYLPTNGGFIFCRRKSQKD